MGDKANGLFLLQPAAMNMIPAQMQIPGLDMSANLHSSATEVLCLMNMVETDELMDDEEYEGTDCYYKTSGVQFATRKCLHPENLISLCSI